MVNIVRYIDVPNNIPSHQLRQDPIFLNFSIRTLTLTVTLTCCSPNTSFRSLKTERSTRCSKKRTPKSETYRCGMQEYIFYKSDSDIHVGLGPHYPSQ